MATTETEEEGGRNDDKLPFFDVTLKETEGKEKGKKRKGNKSLQTLNYCIHTDTSVMF